MQWSERQKRIIEGRGNMLVSASAGSGKTTVMIERIRRLVSEGAALDDMLISTYTVAAAADMRYKLAQALENGNDNCRTQLERLPQARIGTLHSLCQKLIQSHFYLTDVDPAFTVLAENEAVALKQAAVSEVLARGGDARFSMLYDALLVGRSDRPFQQLLLSLYDFSRTQPDPDAWLDGCLELYDRPETVERSLAAYYDKEKARLLAAARDLAVETAAAGCARINEGCRGLEAYIETGTPPKTLSGRIGDFADLNERYKALKSRIAKFRQEVDSAAALAEAGAAREEAAVFVRLVREVGQAYQGLKSRKGALDYGDLEHKALEILTAGEPVAPFRFVFVDEYQDINPLQERIVELLSKEAELFQVGDVKQSIYAFRLCDPDIFLRRFEAYRTSGGGEAIELNVNYRSDGGVLDAVNRVFDRLMTRDLGGVDYAATARLTAGRPQRTPDAVTFKVLCGSERPALPPVYRVTLDAGVTVSAQAALVAADVAGVLSGTRDGRPVRPEDAAVIMRSRSPLMYEIAAALEALGIESTVCAKQAPAQSEAVRPLLNALRLIDNRQDDVILAAVLLSPFGRFTLEELAGIGSEDGFAQAVAAYEGPLKTRLDAFIERFDRYERLAAYTPADELAGIVASEAEYFEALYASDNGRALAAEAGAFLAMMSESGHCGSLTEFLEYALSAEASERPVGPGAVRLMTVHGSKGLEFDYVFLAGTETAFRLDDVSRPVSADRELGLCVKRFDEACRTVAETKLTRLKVLTQRKRLLEEELRILYVAMTRARERLFLYGKRSRRYEGGELSPTCALNLLLPAFVDVRYVDPADCVPAPPVRKRLLSRPDPALKDEIARRLSFEYPYEHIPQKTTVTRTAEAYSEEPDYTVPAAGFDGERAAEIGTAYHLLMEHIEFGRPFEEEWARLGALFPKESALCDREKIAAAAKCVAGLSAGYRLYREKEFIVSRDGVLVQGVIDLLLVKGNEAVVLDYKTTRADDLVRGEYVFQTGFYARAVENLLGLKVTRVLLYSFYLGKTVEMPYDSLLSS